MRFAAAQRRMSTRKISKFSDKQKVNFEWATPILDSATKRIIGSTPHLVQIKGYLEELTEEELRGTSLSKFDRRLVLDADDVEDKGFVIKNDMLIKVGAETWNIISVFTGPYAIPNEYQLLVRKS